MLTRKVENKAFKEQLYFPLALMLYALFFVKSTLLLRFPHFPHTMVYALHEYQLLMRTALHDLSIL